MHDTCRLNFSRTPAALRLFVMLCALASSAQAAAPLVGLWRFDEGSGTNVADASGFGNNGWLASDGGTLPTWDSGRPGMGGALRFSNDGSTHSYVEIPGTKSLRVGPTAASGWTLAAWAYEDSGGTSDFVATYGRILTIDDGAAFQLESGASGDGQMYTWSRAATAWQIGWGATSAVAPLLDQWVHWAVVYDGKTLTLYRNAGAGAHGGLDSRTVTAALAFAESTGEVHIGAELGQSGNRNWNGLLDDVAIFAGALSAAEVRTIMGGDFSAHLGGPARIVTAPQPVSALAGSTVDFDVVAQGQAPLIFQWFFNATNRIQGATNSTLGLTNVSATLAGAYMVVVSNALGAATSAPVQLTVHAPSVALAALWRFDEGAGTNVADASGHGNGGTLMTDGAQAPSWAPGKPGFGSALSFSNDGQTHMYVDIPGSPSLQIGPSAADPWTLTCWAMETGDGSGGFAATYGRLLVIDGGDAFQWESGAAGDAQMYTWSRAVPAWQHGWGDSSQTAPILDQWVHWALVYDGALLTVYRNGNQGGTGGVASFPVSASLSFPGSTGSVQLGTEPSQPASRQWNGLLDDVAFFTGALTQAQLQTVMSGDFSAYLPVPLTAAFVGGRLSVSWPAAAGPAGLESSTNLTGAAWEAVAAAPTLQNGAYVVPVTTDARTRFFRLLGR
jgi:Concanavalin A-like lectin/glucanases superfamily